MDERIARYQEAIITGNKIHNLVSRKAGEAELSEHIQDSLALQGIISLRGQRIIDIGSGQGFPAIPLAIMEPEGQFVLVESELKKAQFLESMQVELGLANVTVVRTRVEELAHLPGSRGQFDVVTCRAVAGLATILEWGLPLLKTGGVLVAWKGPRAAEEVQDSKKAMEILGGRLREVKYYQSTEKTRALVMVDKTGDSPDRYPRPGGTAKKKPL